ncbi:MAG: asparagine synthase, partial [Planctomycetes bacterium]|nr:asparagine synthase [Planctomycetota bacterium]
MKSVDRQRVSEVPIGAFLSGGIDSSTIVAALQQMSSRPVKTFTAKFENAQYDESPIARAVAKHLGTDHHEFVIPNKGFVDEDLWRVIRHMGQPFADSSAIPTFYICEQIRKSVTVCLSGDGGDEMFGGYTFFRDCQRVDSVARYAPRWTFQAANIASRRIATIPGLSNNKRLRQLTQVTASGARSEGTRFLYTAPLFDEHELTQLFRKDLLAGIELGGLGGLALYSGDSFPTRLRQWMAYRVGFQLPEDMLVKVDRMSMANSLEVRAPMLDTAVSDVARRLPDRLLIKNGVTKYILREAARPWLPSEVFDHPKWGFAIPLHEYQNQRYEQMCRELILAPGKLVHSLFNPKTVERIVTRGLT